MMKKEKVKKKIWQKPKVLILSIKETYGGVTPGASENLTYSIS